MFKCLKLLLYIIFLFNLQQSFCMWRNNRIHNSGQPSTFTTWDRTEHAQEIGEQAPPPSTPLQFSPESSPPSTPLQFSLESSPRSTSLQFSPERSPVHESIDQYGHIISNDGNRNYPHTFTFEELQNPEDPPEPYSDNSDYSSFSHSATSSSQRSENNLYIDLQRRLGNMKINKEGESSTPNTDEPNLYYNTEENDQPSENFGNNQNLQRSGRNSDTSYLMHRVPQTRTRPNVHGRGGGINQSHQRHNGNY